jgi:hypothetical protein
VLAALQGYLQGRLRSPALEDGFWREPEWLPFINPALDVVQTSFATQLVQGPEVLRGLGERAMPTVIAAF